MKPSTLPFLIALVSFKLFQLPCMHLPSEKKPTFANSTSYEQNCVLDLSLHFEMLKYEQLSINRRILHSENLSILNESLKFQVVLLYIA